MGIRLSRCGAGARIAASLALLAMTRTGVWREGTRIAKAGVRTGFAMTGQGRVCAQFTSSVAEKLETLITRSRRSG